MKLDLDLLRQITRGAVKITQEKDGFHFYRMTPSQIHAYDDNADFQRKTFGCSSIRLEFKTTAAKLHFSVHARMASSREFCYFDVEVNGVLLHHVGTDSCVKEPEMKFSLDLEEKNVGPVPEEKVVTLYFPNLSEAVLHELELEGTLLCEKIPVKHTLLAFGDSITQGYDAIHPCLAYTNRLGKALRAEVFNKAVGGDTFRPEVIDQAEAIQPDLITVAYGTNDWSKNPREILEGKAREFFEKLIKTYPGIPVYVLLPIWRKDCHRVTLAGTFPEAREMIRDIASKYPQVICIDGLELLPHVEEFYSDKYLHPNDLGFCLMAESLLSKIRLPGI